MSVDVNVKCQISIIDFTIIHTSDVEMSKPITSQKIEHSRTIGYLFLVAFLTYGIGRGSIESQALSEQIVGVLLISFHFIIVFTIGLLLNHTIYSYDQIIGNIYLFSRIFESMLLSTIILTLPLFQPFASFIGITNDNGYNLAMLILGLGSIPLCFCMYKHNIIPPWLSISGIISYTAISIGFFNETFKINKFNDDIYSLILLVGGIWEVVFALYLIIFRSSSGITGQVEIVN